MAGPIPFGKYVLLERANIGGMAEVFKAKSFGVDGFARLLAIKRILPMMAEDDEFIKMFIDEARISVQLSHANIVQVFELGKFETQYYIAMEYISGTDLRHMLDAYHEKEERMPVAVAAYIASKIAEGLDYAHRKADDSGVPMGIIHRDVSPQNILVGYDGAVKVTDFGIAKAEDRSSKTQAGVLKGKFAYMSPEQVRGLAVDSRSDLFSVGNLLYEMLTGERLFLSESDFTTLERVRAAEIEPPTTHNPDIPPELEAVVLKCLAREPDDRYAHGSDLSDDLQQFLIEDRTIFNTKKFSAVMHELYAEQYAGEAAKLKEFSKVTAPQSAAIADAQHAHAVAPTANTDWQQGGDEDQATMIFDAQMVDEVRKQHAAEQSQGGFGNPTMESSNPGHSQSGSFSGQPMNTSLSNSVVNQRSVQLDSMSHGSYPEGFTKSGRRDTFAADTLDRLGVSPKIAASIGGGVILLLALIVILMMGGENGGTLEITSQPVTQVDIFLDQILVGNKTPLTINDVSGGQHELTAKAAGYTEKSYRFNLAEGGIGKVNIMLESTSPTSLPVAASPSPSPSAPVTVVGRGQGQAQKAPIGDATLVIMTEPEGAKVTLSGQPRGVSTLTIAHLDVSQPLLLQIEKTGFEPLVKMIVFTATEIAIKNKTVFYELQEKGVAPDVNNDSPATAVASMLHITSGPSGAVVWINKKKKGFSPLDIGTLKIGKKYMVEVRKRGYTSARRVVTLAQGADETVHFEMEKESAIKTARKATKHGRKSGGNCKGKGAKLSVMARGQQDCMVTVGRTKLGMAPFFKKSSPIGSCKVSVICAGGKKASKTMTLASGDSAKYIIAENEWR